MASVRATLDLMASPGFLATEDKQQQAGHASVVRFLFLGAACISTFPNGGARGDPRTACSPWGTSHTVSRRRTVSLPLSPQMHPHQTSAWIRAQKRLPSNCPSGHMVNGTQE